MSATGFDPDGSSSERTILNIYLEKVHVLLYIAVQ